MVANVVRAIKSHLTPQNVTADIEYTIGVQYIFLSSNLVIGNDNGNVNDN